jgi:hypothetical protein
MDGSPFCADPAMKRCRDAKGGRNLMDPVTQVNAIGKIKRQ